MMYKAKEILHLRHFSNFIVKTWSLFLQGGKMLFWRLSLSFRLISSRHRLCSSDRSPALIKCKSSAQLGETEAVHRSTLFQWCCWSLVQHHLSYEREAGATWVGRWNFVFFPQTMNLSASLFSVHSSSRLLFCLTLFCHSFQLLGLVSIPGQLIGFA